MVQLETIGLEVMISIGPSVSCQYPMIYDVTGTYRCDSETAATNE